MKKNTSLDLMSQRLGLYKGMPEASRKEEEPLKSDLEGLEEQATRLANGGGFIQQDRMIYDKRRSLDRALKYSYQGANIKKVSEEESKVVRALINPDKNKQDYDDKILSVHYEDKISVGDVFEWIGTNTFWLVYLQDLTELAYFRGEIRRCSYTISWEDGTTYAAVRGPTETKIDYVSKHDISMDRPNYSLNILLPRTEETTKYFKRYARFFMKDTEGKVSTTCWRVEAVDGISTPGILEVNATEYYSNEFEDDLEKGIADGRIEPPTNPNPSNVETLLDGDSFIKPNKVYEYTYKGLNNGLWSVSKGTPVEFAVDPNNPLHIKLIWTSPYSGQFELTYGLYTKVIKVDSLF